MNDLIKKYSKEAIAAVLLLLTYFPTILWMWDRWFAKDSYYSHGILIPFVSGYLIWQRKEQLMKVQLKPSAWGMRLIVLGVGIHLLSSLFRVYFTSGFSILITLVGIILNFYGSEVLRLIAFPVAFLFFMVPLPLFIITNMSF